MADFADRVKDTTTTTGTGSIALAGSAPAGFRTFASAFSVADRVYYAIIGPGATEWEVGYGTLSASTTLARTTVLASSNAGAVVNFSAGTKEVFCTIAAQALIRATIAQLRAAALDKLITTELIETASAFVALTSSGGSIAIDWDAGINFSHTFTENTVFANPTNGQSGTWRTIRTTQHASSPKTLGVGSQYHSVGGAAIAATMTNSAVDHYVIMCITSSLFVIFPSLNVADVP